MRSLALLAFMAVLPGCGVDASPDAASSESALTAVPASQPVDHVVTIPMRVTGGREPTRLYLPVTKDGIREHIIVDCGTSRTWFTLAGATQMWTPNAFVATIGDQLTSILGRGVPPFVETVGGRRAIGALGNDFITSGPTEIDVRRGVYKRFPPGTPIPSAASWPTMKVTLKRGILLGEAVVDGRLRQLQIDTGAPTTMLVGEQGQPGDTQRIVHDVLGHGYPVWDGHGDITLAPGIESPHTQITRAPEFPHFTIDIAQALGLPLDGVLGLAAIGYRSIIIDIAAGVMRIEPSN
jgi:hypothetical protein